MRQENLTSTLSLVDMFEQLLLNPPPEADLERFDNLTHGLGVPVVLLGLEALRRFVNDLK